MAAPQVGAIVGGYRFKGGNPNDKSNWEAVASQSGPPVGTEMGGYRFRGGDPNDKKSWAPITAAEPAKPAPPKEDENFLLTALKKNIPSLEKAYATTIEDLPSFLATGLASVLPPSATLPRLAIQGLGTAARESEAYKGLTGGTVQKLREKGERGLAELGPGQYGSVFTEPGITRKLGSLAETVTESALPTLAGLATGVVTRNPAAAATVMGFGNVPLTYGGIRETQKEQGIDDIQKAATGAAASAALDILTGVGGKVLGIAEAAATRQILEAGVRQAAVRVAKSGRDEAGTEMLQNIIEQVAGGVDATTKQAMLDTLESGLAGGFGGTVFTGATELAAAPFRPKKGEATERDIAASPQGIAEFQRLASEAVGEVMAANPGMSKNDAANIVAAQAEKLRIRAVANILGTEGDLDVDTRLDVTGGGRAGIPSDLEPGGAAVGAPELGEAVTGRVGEPVPSVPVPDVGTRAGEPALKKPTAKQVNAALPVVEQAFTDAAIDFEENYGVTGLTGAQKKMAARMVVEGVDPYDAIDNLLQKQARAPVAPAAPVPVAPSVDQQAVEPVKKAIETAATPTPGAAVPGLAETAAKQTGIAPTEEEMLAERQKLDEVLAQGAANAQEAGAGLVRALQAQAPSKELPAPTTVEETVTEEKAATPATKTLNDLAGIGTVNPENTNEVLVQGGGVQLTPVADNVVQVDSLRAVEKGGGRKAMEQLVQTADANGTELQLSPEPFAAPAGKEMSPTELTEWYKGFGFQEQPDGSMVRPAAASPATSIMPSAAPSAQQVLENVDEFARTEAQDRDLDPDMFLNGVADIREGREPLDPVEFAAQFGFTAPGEKLQFSIEERPVDTAYAAYKAGTQFAQDRIADASKTAEIATQEKVALKQKEQMLNRMKKAPGKTARQKLIAIMNEDAKKEVDDAIARNDTPEEVAEDLGINPYDPNYEEIVGQAGLDTERLLKLQIQKYKGSPTEMASVIAKELLQNSHDATRAAIRQGLISQGKIDITTSNDGRTITIYDNGQGMSGELLAQAFLKLGSTGKTEGQHSGGFGMAKSLLLYGTDKADVITAKDGKIATLDTSGQQMFDAALAANTGDMSLQPRIKVRDFTPEDYAMFPEGHGTIVQLLVPETDTNPETGKVVKVAQLPNTYYEWRWELRGLTHSPLFANTNVTYNGRNIPVGSNFPLDEYKTFARVEMPFGVADIYITREPADSPDTHILSDGVWQFDKLIKGLNDKVLPYKIYMNFVPYENVKPDSALYPFNEQRKNFSDSGEAAFVKLASLLRTTFGVSSFLDDIESFGSIQYYDPLTGLPGEPIDLVPEIPQDVIDRLEKAATGDESQIKIGSDGRVEVNGNTVDVENIDDLRNALPSTKDLIIDQSKIDANRVMLHDAADVIVTDPNTGDERQVSILEYMRERFSDRFDQYLFYVGSKFNELRNEVVKVMDRKFPGQYKALLDEAIGNSLDPRYRGVSTKVPFSGMFLNPLVPESSDPYERLEGIVTTMIHELAHYKVRSHNSDFPAEMQRIEAALRAEKRRQGFDFNGWVDEFVENIVDSGYGDIIDAGQYLFATKKDREDGTYGYVPEYTNARVVYRGGRFADHADQQIPERGAQGQGAAENDGATGAGGAGVEPLLGPSYEGRRGAGERGEPGGGPEGGAQPITDEAVDKAVSVKLTKAQMKRIEAAAGIQRRDVSNMQKRIVQSRNTNETMGLIKRLTQLSHVPGEDVGLIASLTRSLPPQFYEFLLGFQQIETVFGLARKAGIKSLQKIDDMMRNGYIPYVNRIIMSARKIDEMWGAFATSNPEGNMALDDVIMLSNMMNVDPTRAPTAAEYMLIDEDLRSLQWNLLQSKDEKEKKGLKQQIGRRQNAIKDVYAGGKVSDPDTGEPILGKDKKPVVVAGWIDVPPEGRKIYKAARDFYRNNFDEHYRLLMQRVDDAGFDKEDAARVKSSIKKMFDKARERVIYFPVKRFGKYWVSVGNDFYMRESASEMKALVKRLKREGETRPITPGKGHLRNAVAKNDASKALKDILDLLDDSNTPNADGTSKISDMDDLRDLVFQMYLTSLPEADMRRRFIHREFKTGFSTDALRTFATTAVASANQLGRLAYNYKFKAAIAEAEAETEENEMKPWLDTITNEVDLKVDRMMAPQQGDFLDAVIAFAGKLNFFNLLSSPSSAFMNLTQLHIVGLPVLSAEFGEAKTAAMASRYTASFLLGQEVPNPFRNEEGNLALQMPEVRFENSGYMRRLKKSNPERYQQTLQAWEYANEHDIIESTFSAGANLYERSNVPTGEFNFRQAVRRGEVLTAAQRAGANTINALGFFFHNSEKIARSIMYMSSFDLAYERAIKQGKSAEEAGLEARNAAAALTNKAMFDFSNWNKSRFAQSRLGRLPLQMQAYRQSMYMLLTKSFVRMLPYMNKEGKLAAARVFFGVAGMTALYGGLRVTHISGMVLAAYTILKFVESLFDDEDDEEKKKEIEGDYLTDKTIEREIMKFADKNGHELALKDVDYYIRAHFIPETFGRGGTLQKALNLKNETADKLATVADMGLPALGGVDLSNSVSLSEFWSPVESKGNTPEVRALETLARFGLGPTAASVAQYVKAGQAWNEGDIPKGFEAILPAVVRNYIKSERLQSEGLRIGKNEDIVLKDTFYYTSGKAALISMGFRDAETSREMQLDIAAGKIEDEIVAEQGKLLDRRYRAILDFDADPTPENLNAWQAAERDIAIYNLNYPSNAITEETKEKSFKGKSAQASELGGGLSFNPNIPVRQAEAEARAAKLYEQ